MTGPSGRRDLGATGRYPHGKLNADDEGELKAAVGVTNRGMVCIDFGKSVKWLAMSPDEADEIARMIMEKAAAAREQDPMRAMIEKARRDVAARVTPRDDTERAIVNAVGEISPDEAVAAIERHRTKLRDGHMTEPNA